MGGLAYDPSAGKGRGMGLAGIDHRLQLGVGEPALGEDRDGQNGAIGRGGRRDRRHGSRLDQRRGVDGGAVDGDAAQAVGLVEPHVVALAAPVDDPVVQGRDLCEKAHPVRGQGQGSRPGRQDRRPGDGVEASGLGRRARGDGRSGLGGFGEVGAGDEGGAIGGDAAVDDQKTRFHRRPMARIGSGREGDPADDRRPGLEPGQSRRIVQNSAWNDRRQAPAVGEGRQGRGQMRVQVLEGRVEHDRVEGA